jgi:hypothetical protein
MTTQVIIRRTSVSDGARALKNSLNEKGMPTMLSDKQTYPRKYLIVNWGGTSQVAGAAGSMVLNKPEAVNVARNKLTTFDRLKAAGFGNLPDYWTKAPTAVERGKSIILQRTVDGQSGSGITIKRPGEALSVAPLYVRYVPKEIELRVHVMNGKAIAVQQKRKKNDVQMAEDKQLIRSHHNGWVFAVNDISREAAEAAKPVAVEACRLLGLDFGAVDIVIPKGKTAKPPVFLEVNTRPGLESTTILGAYADELKAMAKGVHPTAPVAARRVAKPVARVATKRPIPVPTIVRKPRTPTRNATVAKRTHEGLANVQNRRAGQVRR